MGQALRTTKLPLDFSKRTQGGANTRKRAYLEATVQALDAARAFYVAFFLAHSNKLSERVPYFSKHHHEMRERLISSDKLLTWAEFQIVETREHLCGNQRLKARGGKLFCCSACRYEVHADLNASVNVHRSFFSEYHWRPPPKRSG